MANLLVAERNGKLYKPIFYSLNEFTDRELLERYRFDRYGINNLCELLRGDMEHPTRKSQALPIETQVLASLRYLATGCHFIVIADTLNISKASVVVCVDKFDFSNHLLSRNQISSRFFLSLVPLISIILL